MEQIFSPEQLKEAVKHNAYYLESCIFLNDGKGKFTMTKLPMEAQFSPVYAIAAADVDGNDGDEIILAGNLYESKPEAGIYDASYGLVLKQTSQGQWKPMPIGNFFIKGEARDIKALSVGSKGHFVITTMGDSVRLYEQSISPPLP